MWDEIDRATSDYQTAFDVTYDIVRGMPLAKVLEEYGRVRFRPGFIEMLSYYLNSHRRAVVGAFETVLKERSKELRRERLDSDRFHELI